jgi:hypothetical protein
MADPRSKLSVLVDPPLAEPPSMSELRRLAQARRRRTVASRGGLAAAVAVVLISAGVALAPGDKPQTLRTAAPSGSTVPGAGGSLPAQVGPVTVPVTSFEVAGKQWTMLATRTAEAAICFTLRPAAGEALSPGCLTPDGRAVQGAGADLESVSYLYGIVAADVTQVTMSADGNSSALALLGRGSGFPVTFVGTVVPPSVTTVELAASRNAGEERVTVPMPAHLRVSAVHGTQTPPAPPSTTATTARPAPAQPPTTIAPAPDTPVSTIVPPTTPPATTLPGGGQPKRVEPVAGATDLRKHVFQSASATGPQSVGVRFWNGVEPCYVLGRVDVAETASSVTITLWTGTGPAAAGVACIQVAAYYEVIVQLQGPLGTRTVIDGAA